MATHTVRDPGGSILIRMIFPPPSPRPQKGEIFDGSGAQIGYVLCDYMYTTSDYFSNGGRHLGTFQMVSHTKAKQSSTYFFGEQKGYLKIQEGVDLYWAQDWSEVASGEKELEFVGKTSSEWTNEDSSPILANVPRDQFGFVCNMCEGGQRLIAGMAVFAFELLE